MMTADRTTSLLQEHVCGICMLIFSAQLLSRKSVLHTSPRPAEAIAGTSANSSIGSAAKASFHEPEAAADGTPLPPDQIAAPTVSGRALVLTWAEEQSAAG